jgi:Flp pilus assembly protein TadD
MLSSRPCRASIVSAILLAGLGLAGCAANDGRPDSAKNLSDLSEKGESMLKLGNAARDGGDCQAAMSFYRLVKDKDDSHAETAAARAGAADCELSMSALPDAERDYRVAMTLAPKESAPLIGLGRVALVQHKPADAATFFDRAIAKGADAAFVWNDKGVAYDQLRRHKEAQQAYRKGLAKYPTDSALRNNLALSLAMTHDFAEAETLLRGLAAEPGATARTRQNLALVLGLEGNAAAARRVSQDDLDGAALDNNGRFYQYARELMVGEPMSSAPLESDETEPVRTARAEMAPVPPPVLVAKPLSALRTAEPTIGQAALPPPTAAKIKTTQTAALPPPERPAAAPAPVAVTPATAVATPAPAAKPGQPIRVVASDGGALKTEPPAKATGPVASSENQ